MAPIAVVWGSDLKWSSVTVDATAAEQIVATDDVPKSTIAYNKLKPVLGSTSLVVIDGNYWKNLRKMFNPAFAPNYLQTLVPIAVEESLVFVENLKEAARTDEVVYMLKLLIVSSFVMTLTSH